jgi:hypothetical protein
MKTLAPEAPFAPASTARDGKTMMHIQRAVNHQIGTFDAAWNLSDPWPGEGEETGVMAVAPEPIQLTA